MQLATMLGAPGAVLQLPADEWHAGVTAVLREAFTYHFEHNAFFRAQCAAAGVTPADIAVRADLARVPLLPVSMFKRPDAHVLLSVPLTDVELEIRSTGTGGVRSVTRRDATTVTRVACAIVAGRMTRHIVGPPFMVNGLLRFLELEAGPVTHGMIESNLLAVECAHQRKHVPPWCHVSIRDVTDTAVELPPGAPGAIAILNALNTSYPGFLLSDDVGAVDETPCPCGRSGQTFSFHRRMHGDELGCGAAE
jgi:phenylacetate-coenzyme A ligase PaaK-like adenylate-forming protein